MRRSSWATLAWHLSLRVAVAPICVGAAHAQVGVVADNYTKSAIVFDAATMTPRGAVAIGDGSGSVGDCSVNGDASKAFVSDFNAQVWDVDLNAIPPQLVDTEPIPIATFSQDTALTPDGRFLVVCDGFGAAPVSVVDTALRVEVSTLALGGNCSAVDVCDDGTVLATSSGGGYVHKLLLDANGVLTHSGEKLDTEPWFATRGPNDAVCAPGSASGVVVRRFFGAMRSFLVQGMTQVDESPLAGGGISAAIGQDVVWVRSANAVEAFDFDPATGALGATARLTIATATAPAFLGTDQIAIEPGGARVFVPEPNILNAYDATNGSPSGSLVHAGIVAPSGICFPSGSSSPPPDPNLPPDCSTVSANVNTVFPPNGKFVPVSIGGATDPDGDPVVLAIDAVSQDEPVLVDQGTCPDAQFNGATAQIRAERMGSGDGRIYRIHYTATDDGGASCSGTVEVCVSHSKKSGCVASPGDFDSSVCQ